MTVMVVSKGISCADVETWSTEDEMPFHWMDSSMATIRVAATERLNKVWSSRMKARLM